MNCIRLYVTICVLIATWACDQKESAKAKKIIDKEMEQHDSLRHSGFEDVNGIRMYYEIYGYGEGKPLVLLHGGGSTIQSSFGRLIPHISKKRKIIGIELQAHGRTSDRNAPISFEQDADDVAALLKKLNIVKADVLGFSNGGNSAMQIAVRHPEMTDRIIVASSFYKRSGMQPGFWDMMKKGTIDDMPVPLKHAFLEVTRDSSKLQNLFNKCSERMLKFNDWDEGILQSIRAKTLVVAGDNDVAVSEHYVEMHRLIPQSELLIIPGGHGQYMGEISFPHSEAGVESFANLIDDFLRN